MDLHTKLLLGATAAAVIGYFGLIYGSCALDAHCHLRTGCTRHHVCGVVYDPGSAPRAR